MMMFRRWRAPALAAALAFFVSGQAFATNLLNRTFTTAVGATATTALDFPAGVPRSLTIQAKFTYGSGGTTVDAYVQTTLDGGGSWIDIANFSFTTATAKKVINLSSLTPVTSQATPADGALAANTAVDGILGGKLRIKYVSTGTYAGGTTLSIDVQTTRLN